MDSHRISIKSSYDDVHLVAPWLHQLAEQAGMSEAATMQLELAVVEAVNNVVEHAYQLQDGHTVQVLGRFDAQRLVIEIWDTGMTMNTEKLEKIKAEQDDDDAITLMLLEESGRGLRLMTQLVDDVDYLSDGTMNRLVLVKLLNGTE
ncbi:ATP-binding protein [Methylobacillus flagellatus]|uniref:ATP-binding protein n=1 Tax=Methylobacillus flagellatus TaxID=405 RepID=UPI0010F78E9E|nr:ATP-binding protein [Methylobacillus flagellatus]